MPEFNAHLFDFGQSAALSSKTTSSVAGTWFSIKRFFAFLLCPALVPDFVGYPRREPAVKRGVLQRLEIGPLALMRCCA